MHQPHVLPKGYVRIRHFGFLANRLKKENIDGLVKSPKTPSPLTGEGEGEGEKGFISNTYIPLPLIPSRQGRGNKTFYESINIKRCRELIGNSKSMPESAYKTTQELMLDLTGVDITVCPCCKEGTMRIVEVISPLWEVKPQYMDSS